VDRRKLGRLTRDPDFNAFIERIVKRYFRYEGDRYDATAEAWVALAESDTSVVPKEIARKAVHRFYMKTYRIRLKEAPFSKSVNKL
jgi:hypothetical protein